MRPKLLAAFAAVAVALAAWAAPSLAGGTTTVAVKDNKFVPKSLTIAKGTTVRWVWKGRERHNVAVAKGPSRFRASTRKKGHYTHTFKRTGTYRLVCTIHAPDMRMRVTVK
jgi:plastocyanin